MIVAKHVLAALYELERKIGPDLQTAICHNVICYINRIDEMFVTESRARKKMRELFEKWPHYSGAINYPIPAPPRDEWVFEEERRKVALDDLVEPELWASAPNAFTYISRRTFWDPKTTYGRMRIDLLNFMIRELEDEIAAAAK